MLAWWRRGCGRVSRAAQRVDREVESTLTPHRLRPSASAPRFRRSSARNLHQHIYSMSTLDMININGKSINTVAAVTSTSHYRARDERKPPQLK